MRHNPPHFVTVTHHRLELFSNADFCFRFIFLLAVDRWKVRSNISEEICHYTFGRTHKMSIIWAKMNGRNMRNINYLTLRKTYSIRWKLTAGMGSKIQTNNNGHEWVPFSIQLLWSQRSVITFYFSTFIRMFILLI